MPPGVPALRGRACAAVRRRRTGQCLPSPTSCWRAVRGRPAAAAAPASRPTAGTQCRCGCVGLALRSKSAVWCGGPAASVRVCMYVLWFRHENTIGSFTTPTCTCTSTCSVLAQLRHARLARACAHLACLSCCPCRAFRSHHRLLAALRSSIAAVARRRSHLQMYIQSRFHAVWPVAPGWMFHGKSRAFEIF